MARYAIVVNGKVDRCIDTDAAGAALVGAILAPGANIGWNYANGTFSEAAPTETVPTSVTMRQARLALLAAGKLAAVQSAIDALSEPTKTAAQIEWEYSNEVQRHNGLVAALGPALNLTSDQIDTLFIGAAKL